MRLESRDWHALRNTILAWVLVLVLAMLVAGVFQQRKLNAQQALQQQLGQLEQVRRHYQTTVQERHLISQYLPAYRQLVADGFVGEEHRQSWLDALRDIQRQHRLFGIDYRLAAQQPYQPAFWPDRGIWQLYRSIMQLKLAMLHEGDVLTLLDALSDHSAAAFMLRECTLVRQSGAPPPSFRASCELDWLTLHAPLGERS